MPWQRVVRADGSLAKGERQRRLLEAEGVPFRGERVDMRASVGPAGARVVEMRGWPTNALLYEVRDDGVAHDRA